MSDTELKITEASLRNLRKQFMVTAIHAGRNALASIREDDKELADLIDRTFPMQEPRAAFWLATETDKSNHTPLQQLTRGRRDEVIQRLTTYIPLNVR